MQIEPSSDTMYDGGMSDFPFEGYYEPFEFGLSDRRKVDRIIRRDGDERQRVETAHDGRGKGFSVGFGGEGRDVDAVEVLAWVRVGAEKK